MVKTYDFAYGYIDGEYIALYDNSKTKTAEIAVNDSLSDGNYLYFYKTGENLRFVTSRKADYRIDITCTLYLLTEFVWHLLTKSLL